VTPPCPMARPPTPPPQGGRESARLSFVNLTPMRPAPTQCTSPSIFDEAHDQPAMPTTLTRTAIAILAKRNTPFSWSEINALHASFRAGRPSGLTLSTPLPQPKSAVADFGHFVEWPNPRYSEVRLRRAKGALLGWGSAKGGHACAIASRPPTPRPSPTKGEGAAAGAPSARATTFAPLMLYPADSLFGRTNSLFVHGVHPLGETRKLGTGCDWGLVRSGSSLRLVV
jgi:hypothetical protein